MSSNRNKILYKLRNSKAPKLPKTTADIELVIPNCTQTSDHERFLFFDTEDSDQIICFASDFQLECLINSKRLFMMELLERRQTSLNHIFLAHFMKVNFFDYNPNTKRSIKKLSIIF